MRSAVQVAAILGDKILVNAGPKITCSSTFSFLQGQAIRLLLLLLLLLFDVCVYREIP
jgi:hypothetical protein